MNAIYLHPTDGFTFLENVPEKPIKKVWMSRGECGCHLTDRCACMDYELTLAEAIEKRMVIGNVPEYKFPQMKEGDLLPWLGTYSKDVFNTKVILSPPKEDKNEEEISKQFDWMTTEKAERLSKPVNSSMSEKEN